MYQSQFKKYLHISSILTVATTATTAELTTVAPPPATTVTTAELTTATPTTTYS